MVDKVIIKFIIQTEITLRAKKTAINNYTEPNDIRQDVPGKLGSLVSLIIG